MRASIVFLVAPFDYVSWRLYHALARGSVTALRGGYSASREDHPIIYWSFTGFLGVIWAFLALAIVSAIAPGQLPSWLAP